MHHSQGTGAMRHPGPARHALRTGGRRPGIERPVRRHRYHLGVALSEGRRGCRRGARGGDPHLRAGPSRANHSAAAQSAAPDRRHGGPACEGETGGTGRDHGAVRGPVDGCPGAPARSDSRLAPDLHHDGSEPLHRAGDIRRRTGGGHVQRAARCQTGEAGLQPERHRGVHPRGACRPALFAAVLAGEAAYRRRLYGGRPVADRPAAESAGGAGAAAAFGGWNADRTGAARSLPVCGPGAGGARPPAPGGASGGRGAERLARALPDRRRAEGAGGGAGERPRTPRATCGWIRRPAGRSSQGRGASRLR